MSRPRSLLRSSLAVMAASAMLAACQSAPVTGRDQFILVSEGEAAQMGAQAWQQVRAETVESNNRSMNRVVQEAGRRIAAVSDAPGLDWEFMVIDDEAPNAFALPGGKIAVHTGLFDVAETEDQIAAVIGHEIAHVTARHSSERLSQQIALQVGLTAGAMASSDIAA